MFKKCERLSENAQKERVFVFRWGQEELMAITELWHMRNWIIVEDYALWLEYYIDICVLRYNILKK